MTPAFAALLGHIGVADLFGLIASVIVLGYLLFALLRGEKL
jgi:hypothetical protein